MSIIIIIILNGWQVECFIPFKAKFILIGWLVECFGFFKAKFILIGWQVECTCIRRAAARGAGARAGRGGVRERSGV